MEPLKLADAPILKFPYYPCPNAFSQYRGLKISQVGILGTSGAPIVTITGNAFTVQLNHPKVYRVTRPTYNPEIPIPTRKGGQVQALGSGQRTFEVSGICDVSTEVTGANGIQHLDDIANDFTHDCTLTALYGADTILNAINCRLLEPVYWPVAGSTMYWFAYSIKLKEKA